MRKLTITGLFIGTLAVGMVIGGWCMARYEARAFVAMTFDKPEVDNSFLASEYDLWAAQLRLGQVGVTITNLEDAANAQVAAIAVWDYVAPPDKQTREARDRFLHAVKTYEESYPPTGRSADAIKTLLSTVPGRSPQSTCNDAICQIERHTMPNTALEPTPTAP